MTSLSDADTIRCLEASKAIIDNRFTSVAGRRPDFKAAEIMVTLEQVITTVLLALYDDPKMAARMLNEALVPGVEERLALYAKRTQEK